MLIIFKAWSQHQQQHQQHCLRSQQDQPLPSHLPCRQHQKLQHHLHLQQTQQLPLQQHQRLALRQLQWPQHRLLSQRRQ